MYVEVDSSLVSKTEELLGRNSSGSGLESRDNGRKDPSLCPRGTVYPQKLALTSPTSGGRSVGIVRSRTQATEFSFLEYVCCQEICLGLKSAVTPGWTKRVCDCTLWDGMIPWQTGYASDMYVESMKLYTCIKV
jgi:hypothetical protein